jgi:hypothetical protein
MKSRYLATAALFALFVSPALAQTDMPAQTGAMPPAVEQCIRDNAAKVEAQFDSLKDGVDFLVGYVCAGPIAAEQRRQQLATQDAMRTMWQRQCDDQKQSGKTDDKNTIDPCTMAKTMASTTAMSNLIMLNPALNKPAYATSLAAQLLLDIRAGRPGKHMRDH